MTTPVTSHSFYDINNSRLQLGFTGTSTPYFSFAPVNPEFQGATQIPKGSRVYNNDGSVFIPITAEMAVEGIIAIDLFLNQETDTLTLSTNNRQRAAIFKYLENGDVVASGVQYDQGGSILSQVYHVFEDYHIALLLIKKFLEVSFFGSFKIIEAIAGPSNNGGYGNNSNYNSGGGYNNNGGTSFRQQGSGGYRGNQRKSNPFAGASLNTDDIRGLE